MESPAKKICLDPQADKENIEARYESDEVAVPIKGIPVLDEALVQQAQKPSPVEELVEVDDDTTEPILRENAQRFVLFPIKYHEVCCPIRASTRTVLALHPTDTSYRYGKCTKRPRRHSGQQRRLIFRKTYTTGTSA